MTCARSFQSIQSRLRCFRGDKPIRRFEDLKGYKVNVGNPGSGQRATMEVVMGLWNEDERLALAAELKGSEMAQALWRKLMR